MALEHNIVYYSTKAEESRRIPKRKVADQKVVAAATKKVTTLADLRTAADLAGVPMSVILKKITDVDQMGDYIADPEYGVQSFMNNDLKKSIEISDYQAAASKNGHLMPAITNDYFSIVYSSYRKKIDEIQAINARLKSSAGRVVVE